MAFFLDSLEPYKEKAIALFVSGKRADAIFFSHATYQFFYRNEIERENGVYSSHNYFEEGFWVFLQCTENGEVGDIFCSCHHHEEDSCESSGCVHMALSWIILFSKGSELCSEQQPLHTRFYNNSSLLHRFLYEQFEHMLVTKEELFFSQERGNSFYIDLKNYVCTIFSEKQHFLQYLQEVYTQSLEIDESSIKFINSSEDEIEKWKKGEYVPSLCYELSFLSEIAKTIFLYMEGMLFFSEKRVPEISFDMNTEKQEAEVRIQCDMLLTISFSKVPFSYLSPLIQSIKENRGDVSLNTCSNPFQEMEEEIEKEYFYEEKKYELDRLERIKRIAPKKMNLSQGIHVDITRNAIIISSTLLGSDEQIELSHIEEQGGKIYGRWIVCANTRGGGNSSFNQSCIGRDWIKAVGIGAFPLRTHIISEAEVPDFLLQHKNWLAKQPGFQLHFCSYEDEIHFRIDSMNHSLSFFVTPQESLSHIVVKEKKKSNISDSCRFGNWIWKRGRGFFLLEEPCSSESEKKIASLSLPLHIPIPPHKVAYLIRSEYEVLVKHVSLFFAPSVPVVIQGLKITYDKYRRKIDITPLYRWEKPEYESLAFFYEEYGYIPKLGFFKMPILDLEEVPTLSVSRKEIALWNHFFLNLLPEIENTYPCEKDICLKIPSLLQLYCNKADPIEYLATPDKKNVAQSMSSQQGWTSDFFWKSEMGTLLLNEVLIALERGEKLIPSDAGLIDVSDTRFLWVHSFLRKRRKKRDGESVHLRSSDFIRIQAHEELFFTPNIGNHENIIQRLLKAETNLKPSLEYFSGSLRPYQETGLLWLWFLYTSTLSGLLCDDMGVGKTHQAMALLAAVYAHKKKESKQGISSARFLIVCPTSLVWHWKEKLDRFLPKLSVYLHVGADRSVHQLVQTSDLVLTTYGTLRKDIACIDRLHFEVSIFDELQIAKNHVSLIWSALSRIQSSMKLGLSGTPIENHVRELKALFDLVLPGYLPDDMLFRELYLRQRGDIESEKRKSLLARSVRPFVLRRKKEDVLPELPSKVEETIHTYLLPDQKLLYNEVSMLQGAPIMDQLQDETQAIPYMHIFSLLSALKQISNHPASYLKVPYDYKRYDSGKWQLFQELIHTARGSGQKVVVFSQYLYMLDIMSLYFQEIGISYSEIRGKTKSRGEAIEKFQKNPDCLVFLGSLQAAGLGIDLTAASIVIHYDRWWNAARENQATDRVHRMGQSQGVQVIKLVTKETVEESIDKMIAQKSHLLDEVVQYDDQAIIKKLSRQDLIELLLNN